MTSQLSCASLKKHPVLVLATGFGSGLAPVAPGTFGSIAAIVVYLIIAGADIVVYAAIVVIMFLAGIRICGRAADILGVHDHPGIVWDEFVGYLVTMFAIPPSWVLVLCGFVLFRIFDVLKPWPIGWVDRKVRGGAGIMLDDVLAGVMAGIALHAGARLAGYTTG